MVPQNKQNILTAYIAREMLFAKKGNKIATIMEYAEKYGVGTGTVQSAFSRLKEYGAIIIRSHGAQGSYIEDINPKRVFELSGLHEFVGLMPLYQSNKIVGLTTGLYECFDIADLPIHLLFSRGSANRMSTVLSGRGDFCIVSSLAYEKAIEKGVSIKKSMEFGASSYRNDFGLLIKKEAHKKTKISLGVDFYSYDHLAILDHLKKIWKINAVSFLYVELVNAVRECKVDAALVGDMESITVPNNCMAVSLIDYIPKAVEQSRRGVLAVGIEDMTIFHLMKKIINPEVVNKVQEEVVEGHWSPRY